MIRKARRETGFGIFGRGRKSLPPGGLEFGGGVEFQFGVVLAGDLQHPFAFGKEHRVVFAVEGYGCRFAPDELLELLLVVAGYPERLVVAERREVALGSVLVFEAELDDVELQFAHRSDDLAAAVLHEELRNTLFGELTDALVELLGLERVAVFEHLEDFRRKARNAPELQILAFGERVADFQRTVVVQADHIPRPGFVDHAFFVGHELRGAGEPDFLAEAGVVVELVALELA